jgi:hypothetical protein
MKDPVYILTSIEKIPVIIECEKEQDVEDYWTKRSIQIGKGCFEANINSGKWVDETNRDRIADILQRNAPHLNKWIQKRDAFV